ncbi:MAG: YhjD/YihY/BrkB family envelope integrity protein [Chloroflexota bacterium]
MGNWQQRLSQTYHQLDRLSGGLPGIIQHTIVSFGQDNGAALAANIAYRALFSFFPLALLLLAVSSNLLNSVAAQEQVVAFIEQFLPTAGALVRDNVASVLRNRGAVGTLAGLGLLWSASSVFSAIDRAINRAWDASVRRSFWRQQALALAIVIGIGLLFFLSTLTTTLFDLLLHFKLPGLGIEPFNSHLGQRLLPLLGPMLVDYLVFFSLYRFLPVVRVHWREVLPGALIASTAWQLAKYGFNLYLRNFASYSLVYGSLTTIIVFLTFTYIAALILVMGAEFSAAWAHAHRERKGMFVRNEKDLAQWIADNGVAAQVILLAVETPTVEAAAAAVDAPPQAILKSLLFLVDGQPYLVMANGLAHVDRGAVAAHLGVGKKRVKMASAEEVAELTGYAVGTVPPFGHRFSLPALMDPGVLQQPTIYAGGGGMQALVRLTPQELARVVQPRIVPLISAGQAT